MSGTCMELSIGWLDWAIRLSWQQLLICTFQFIINLISTDQLMRKHLLILNDNDACLYNAKPIYTWNFESIPLYILRYLEKRFQSRVIRIFAATCFVLLTCLYLAIVVYAPSLALSQVTGLNINLSIVLTFSVCIFYTSIGGIKAVIWTNVFQVFLPIFLCTKFEW